MIALNKVLNLSDFSDPEFVAAMREIYPHELTRFGPSWPANHQYRKDWEVAMAVLALRHGGVLRGDADILGVGAGNEPTIFYLTNHVRRVHATDLYLQAAIDGNEHWKESANVNIFLDPGRYWPGPWNQRRLVVQQMNGLDLQFEDATFDGIFSSGSIEHFGGHPEVRQAAREMGRVLKPGGILSVSTEFRLAGPSPGLPGILMFDAPELTELIVEASGLELLTPFDASCSPETVVVAQNLQQLSANVQAHVAEHGEILFHKLCWPEYPSVTLVHNELVWTSCHLALRKPG